MSVANHSGWTEVRMYQATEVYATCQALRNVYGMDPKEISAIIGCILDDLYYHPKQEIEDVLEVCINDNRAMADDEYAHYHDTSPNKTEVSLIQQQVYVLITYLKQILETALQQFQRRPSLMLYTPPTDGLFDEYIRLSFCVANLRPDGSIDFGTTPMFEYGVGTVL